MNKISVSYVRALVIENCFSTLMFLAVGICSITQIGVNEEAGIIEEVGINGSIKILLIAIFLSILITIVFSLVFKVESPTETQKNNRNKSLSNTMQIVMLVLTVLYIIASFKGDWIVNITVIIPFLLSFVYFFDILNFYIYAKYSEQLE
ncbi:putative membrane protein [Clostridioides difficile CD160]|nr:putative membrane protein [Clostridioides difficile CD160]